MTAHGDSSDVVNAIFPYPQDKGWTNSISLDTNDSTKYVRSLSKYFKNSRILQEELDMDTSSWKHAHRSIEVDKSYGLFYTHIHYKEVYRPFNQFDLIKKDGYLTKKDIQLLMLSTDMLSPKDSIRYAKAEEKLIRWMTESVSAELIEALKADYLVIYPEIIDVDVLNEYEAEFRVEVEDLNLDNMSRFLRIADSCFIEDHYWGGVIDSSWVTQYNEHDFTAFKAFQEKAKVFFELMFTESFDVEVEMPGLITATNSQTVIGNTVSWRIEPIKFLAADYEMTVSSRVLNIWAFVIEGIIILSLIILILIRFFRNKISD
jgi:hypothetical protein